MRYLIATLLIFAFTASANDDGWFPISLEDNYVHIPITLNGIETTAILDTGTVSNYISKDFVAKHGKDLSKGGVTKIANSWDDEYYQLYNEVPIKLFETEFKMDDLIESDLPSGDVVIGMHFFRFYILQVDYPNKRIRMLDRKSVDMKKYNNVDSRVEGDHGVPIVKLSVNKEKEAWFLLDTASPVGLTIDRSLSEKRDWLKDYRTGRVTLKELNQVVEMNQLEIPLLKIGPFEIEKIRTAVPDKGHSLDLRPRYEKSFSRIKGKKLRGSVGFDVLQHFIVTIEYQTGFVHISG